MPFRFDELDRVIAGAMERYGHWLHRVTLGGFFVWMGLLKCFEVKTATSLLAKVIYWNTPEVIVPLLGAWEAAIGMSLLFRPFLRIALLLLTVRLPATFLALVLLPDKCFVSIPFAPTIEGQYLIKDLLLFSAALVIGGTVHRMSKPGVYE